MLKKRTPVLDKRGENCLLPHNNYKFVRLKKMALKERKKHQSGVTGDDHDSPLHLAEMNGFHFQILPGTGSMASGTGLLWSCSQHVSLCCPFPLTRRRQWQSFQKVIKGLNQMASVNTWHITESQSTTFLLPLAPCDKHRRTHGSPLHGRLFINVS